MSPWLWAVRIAVIALGGVGLVFWLPVVCMSLHHVLRQDERWQMKTSYVVFGVSKVALPILFLLIGFGEQHRARSYALFLPEHRSSE